MEEEVITQSRSRVREYEPIVGRSTIEELRILADELSDKVVQNVNSTFVGGGVSEILEHMVPLLNQLGVDARWNVIQGNEEFFDVTKKFHNAIHGKDESFSKRDFEVYEEVTRENLESMDFYGDIMFIHDPQPAGLIEMKEEMGKKWIW